MLATPLTLGRLTLRRWREEDAPALSQAVEESLDHLRRWMPWAVHEPLAPADRVALLRQWEADWESGESRNVGLWADGTVAGACGLHRRVGPGGLEIGYWVHRGHVRRGYATAASRALTTLAFELPEIERVEILPDRGNVASNGVPRRLGFELVGEGGRPLTASLGTGAHNVWRMTRERWAAGAAARQALRPAG